MQLRKWGWGNQPHIRGTLVLPIKGQDQGTKTSYCFCITYIPEQGLQIFVGIQKHPALEKPEFTTLASN